MTEDDKNKIGQRLVTRVSTGLSFIEDNYLVSHEVPDVAWIRNIYLLMSFYTELLCKAIVVIEGNFTDVTDLDNRLKKLGHDLEAIGKVNKDGLRKFGIKDIESKQHEYLVKTDYGVFYVNDCIDIRYNFLDDRVRKLNGNEHEEFKKQIDILLKINDQLKIVVWK